MVIWTYGTARQVAMVSSQNCGTCKVKRGGQKIYFCVEPLTYMLFQCQDATVKT